MKIQYASDLHLEFSDNFSYLKRNPLKPVGDILVLAGDIGYLNDDNYRNHPFWDWASDNFSQTIVAVGNHELYKYYDLAKMPQGLVCMIRDNVKCYYNDKLLTWDKFNREHDKCFSFIQDKVENSRAEHIIVVTHHVPSFQLASLDFAGSRINGAFTVELEKYIETSPIEYWIYGHSHRNIDRMIGKTQCITNQLGYVSHNEHRTFNLGKYVGIVN